MTFPVQITIGSFSISAHMLLETLAFVVGYRYFVYLRSRYKDPIPDTNRVWIFIGAAAGAFIFSRVVGALESPSALFSSSHPLLYLFTSKTIVGGLLGGLLGVELIKSSIGEKNSSGDLFTFPLILAMVIGRTGCFCNGIYESTYGTETAFITGMNLGDEKLRHPVTLYEIAFLTLIWIFIKRIEKRYTLINGIRFRIFMTSYLFFRFALEYIKPSEPIFAGMSIIQISCLIGLLYYSKTIIKLIFKPSELTADAK